MVGVLAGAFLSIMACSRGHGAGDDRVGRVAPATSVAIVRARAEAYQATRSFVGALEPWNEAWVGPQLVSAYVSSVRVRPGAAVRRGQVLATLDCRDAVFERRSNVYQAEAADARRVAYTLQSDRISGLRTGDFVSPDDAEFEQSRARSATAERTAARARTASTDVLVRDCVQRAPFDGEIGERLVDPGAFVHEGTPMLSVVDRTVVRATVEATESDYALFAPGTRLRLRVEVNGSESMGTVARRSPGSDRSSHTAHVEVDVPDADRVVPVHGTVVFIVDVGHAVAATSVPEDAADLRNLQARLIVVERGVAHVRRIEMLGRADGRLYFDPHALEAGSVIVADAHASLADGEPAHAAPDSGHGHDEARE